MLDKVRKQIIGDKEYNFKMTNKTIRKIDEKYGNYGSVLRGMMVGEKFYTNALKLVSMSCIDKTIIEKETDNGDIEKVTVGIEWDIEELEDIITPQQYQDITELAVDLYFDYMGINETTKDEKVKKKEEEEKN